MTAAEYRAYEQSVPWSDVSRDSRNVADKASHRPVRLVRRGADTDLILISADQYRRPDEGLYTALRLLDAYAGLGSREEAARRLFPWMDFLTDVGQAEFVRELFTKLEAAASVSNYTAFHITVGSWRGTAENRAAGIVPADDASLEWFAEPEPVDGPEY